MLKLIVYVVTNVLHWFKRKKFCSCCPHLADDMRDGLL